MDRGSDRFLQESEGKRLIDGFGGGDSGGRDKGDWDGGGDIVRHICERSKGRGDEVSTGRWGSASGSVFEGEKTGGKSKK